MSFAITFCFLNSKRKIYSKLSVIICKLYKQIIYNYQFSISQKIITRHYFQQQRDLSNSNMSTQPAQVPDQKLTTIPDDSTQNNSPIKADKQMLKQKKKKTMALKNFLQQKKTEQVVAPIRKKSSQNQQVNIQNSQSCRICNKEVMKKRNCGFCNYVACNDHLRKKRKQPKTGKFVKICDQCEDKMLFEKYMKHQIKAQEALEVQQMIISSKHQEIADVVNGKRTKATLLLNKRRQIDEDKKSCLNNLLQTENQIRNKQRKLESKLIELDKIEKQLQILQKNLPRSLEEDHIALTLQNQKITKQLVKYQKLCQQALKSKSKKEKDMYEMYYTWEEKQTQKQVTSKKNKQDCLIY